MNAKALMIAATLVIAGVPGAHASTLVPSSAHYFTSYTVTLDAGIPDITNIMMLETQVGSGSDTWAFLATGGATTTLSNPFFTTNIPVESLLIGEVQDLAGDPAGQKHIVLFMNPATAIAVAGLGWGTVFLTTDEDLLLTNLELATSGQVAGRDFVDTFKDGDARNIPDGPGGSLSAWFATGSSFSVMTWSGGQQIGSGSGNVDVVTPEPGSMLLLGLGLSGLALLARRRTV